MPFISLGGGAGRFALRPGVSVPVLRQADDARSGRPEGVSRQPAARNVRTAQGRSAAGPEAAARREFVKAAAPRDRRARGARDVK